MGAKPFQCLLCKHRATQKVIFILFDNLLETSVEGNLKLHFKKHHDMDLPAGLDMTPDAGIWSKARVLEFRS